MESVYSAVRTEYLYKADYVVSFKRVIAVLDRVCKLRRLSPNNQGELIAAQLLNIGDCITRPLAVSLCGFVLAYRGAETNPQSYKPLYELYVLLTVHPCIIFCK